MKLRFIATIDIDDYRKHGVTKQDNIVMLRYADVYKDKIRKELRKIVDKNARNAETDKPPIEIEVNLDIHYAKRSLDQSAWLWAAHTIEANITNGGLAAWNDGNIKWRGAGTVTPEMIHDDYMEHWAPRGYIDVQSGFIDLTRRMIQDTYGRVMKETWDDKRQVMTFEVWKTSSFMNVKEFCELAEHVKENLLSYGIDLDNAADYSTLVEDWEKIKKSAEIAEEPKPEKTRTEDILTRLDNGDTMFAEFGIF